MVKGEQITYQGAIYMANIDNPIGTPGLSSDYSLIVPSSENKIYLPFNGSGSAYNDKDGWVFNNYIRLTPTNSNFDIPENFETNNLNESSVVMPSTFDLSTLNGKGIIIPNDMVITGIKGCVYNAIGYYWVVLPDDIEIQTHFKFYKCSLTNLNATEIVGLEGSITPVITKSFDECTVYFERNDINIQLTEGEILVGVLFFTYNYSPFFITNITLNLSGNLV